MSLETWKAEYYPIPADQTTKENAVAHSLKKWEGLRSKILEQHDVLVNLSGDIEDGVTAQTLGIDAGTCALCHHHWDGSKEEDTDLPPEEHACGTCPLYLARGNHCCAGADKAPGETRTPFADWNRDCNPEPMIAWLKRAQEYERTSHAAPQANVSTADSPKPPIGGLTCETPAKPGILDSTD